MSFKVEIEIDGYNNESCGVCKKKIVFYRRCEVFNASLQWDQNRDGVTLYRCPECIEAEKQYETKGIPNEHS